MGELRGTRDRFSLKNYDDAVRLAEIGGVEMPNSDDQIRYGPLGAVARAVSDKYLGPESIQEFAERKGVKLG